MRTRARSVLCRLAYSIHLAQLSTSFDAGRLAWITADEL